MNETFSTCLIFLVQSLHDIKTREKIHCAETLENPFKGRTLELKSSLFAQPRDHHLEFSDESQNIQKL